MARGTWKMGEYPIQNPKPKTVKEALEEIRSFNHKHSAKIIEKYIKELEERVK